MQKKYFKEILKIISTKPADEIKEALSNYHASDIADALETLDKDERIRIYNLLGKELTAEIVSFYDDVDQYIEELNPEYTADLLEEMDSDDAIDILDELADEDKQEIISLMDDDFKKAINKLDHYDDELIGSEMSDNFITISNKESIKSATKELIKGAGEHDNIFVIFVHDEENKYVGAIDLRDLIVARKDNTLDSIIMSSYPFFYDYEEISSCIGRIKEYAEASFPILNSNNEIIGAITADNILNVASDEMEDDYAKLGGLKESEDLSESTFASIKKRLPWLIILLFLGFIVSSVIGAFEAVIAALPIIVFFQSMILDMSGNVGTQSLAVTIRNITDEGFKNDKRRKRKSILKELRIGFFNGLIMGLIAFSFVLIYLVVLHKEITPGMGYSFNECLLVSFIIGGSMSLSILLSSIIGTAFPLFLDKIHVDPAVASGPFITTLNDIIAVIVYYGLTFIFFISII